MHYSNINGELKMGLAASQARFLGITARKSNIEYEGQQVNQQRTVLSQEVSGLYNKLMELDKPIQPVKSDFYETNYTFELPEVAGKEDYAGNYKIKNFKKEGSSYVLSVTRTYKKDEIKAGLLSNSLNNITKEGDGDNKYKFVDQSGESFDLTKADETKAKTIKDMIKSDCTDAQQPKGENFYFYTSYDGITHYLDSSAVENFSQGSTTLYTYDYLPDQEATDEKTLYANNAEFDGYGNLKSFTDIYAKDEEGNHIELETKAEVNVTKDLNEEKMEEAMRNYTLQVDEYNQEYAKINNETEDLQQQDKVLELRLNQISTEEQELSTELEAVKKVIEENIENTFKTFA